MQKLRHPNPDYPALRNGLFIIAALITCILLFALAGCAQLQPVTDTLAKRETLVACAAADVVTTVAGTKLGLMAEGNPLWKASVGAGHYLPFISATIIAVWLINKLDNRTVTALSSATLCYQGAKNAHLILSAP